MAFHQATGFHTAGAIGDGARIDAEGGGKHAHPLRLFRHLAEQDEDAIIQM